MTVTAAWNALTGLTRQMIRLSTVLMTPTGSLTVRSGVVPGGTPLLLTGSVMTGSVAPGRAIVQGTSAQGAYPVVVDAATPITVANGHLSLSRIDTVFLVVLDHEFDASGSRQGSIVYTQGTAGSGSAPAAPASGTAYLRLWDILVPANASAGSPINWGTALTDQRLYTVSIGGITPGAAAGSYAGQYRDAGGATGILERWSGVAWEAILRLGNSGQLALGDVNLTRSAAATLRVNGSIANLVSADAEDTTARTTTSTSLVTLTGITPPSIVAPASGKVRITLVVMQRNNTGGFTCTSSFRVVGSSSGTRFTETVNGGTQYTGTTNNLSQKSIVVTGFTPGETVTVTPYHQVNGNTGTWDYRYILIEGKG